MRPYGANNPNIIPEIALDKQRSYSFKMKQKNFSGEQSNMDVLNRKVDKLDNDMR